MSRDDVIYAAVRLAQAVVDERRMARMMCECPPDDVDKALDKFVDIYYQMREESWNKKDLPEIK